MSEGLKKEKTVEEVTTLAGKVAEGDEYFAVAHIFASFNDTFVVRRHLYVWICCISAKVYIYNSQRAT